MRRLMMLLALLGLVVTPTVGMAIGFVGGGSPTSRTGDFFGNLVRSGTTLSSVNPGATTNIRLTDVRVSTSSNTCSTSLGNRANCNQVQASATMYIGSDTTPIAVTVDYRSAGDWTVTVSASPTRSGYAPRTGSPVNLSNLTGTLRMSGGTFQTSLSTTGSYRGVTVSGTVTVTPSGAELTATLSDIPLATGGSAGSLQIAANSWSSTVQASILFGGTGPAVNATISFTDRNNWTAGISRDSAEGTAPDGTAVNMDGLSGTITKANGVATASLQLNGTIGGTAFTANMSGSRNSGFEGSATADTVNLPGGYTITGASFTVSTITHTATLAGTLTTGGTNVAVTASYTDTNNWSFSIAANSAPSGYTTPKATSLDLNDLSGTVTSENGAITTNLTVSGVTVGDGTFNMTATISSAGVEAHALVNHLVIGGFTLESGSMTISTVKPYVDITAALVMSAGTFDVDILAEALDGGGYHLKMTADGADLSAGGSDFYMQSFGFTWESNVPASGCTTVDAAVRGSVVIKNATYTLNNAEVAFSCSTLTKFIFSVTVVHKSTWNNQTRQVTLNINWLTGGGTYTPTFGPGNKFTFPGDPYSYYAGFFGTVDLSSTRGFSRSGMDRDVTLGLGFSVAVYQQLAYVQTGTQKIGPMRLPILSPAPGAWTVFVGALGYFDADRVSGDIGCTFEAAPSTDFTCGGDIRINPSFAGVWHYDWVGI